MLFFINMDNYFTTTELLTIINNNRDKEDLPPYELKELMVNIEDDEINNDGKISIIEAVGLLAYQTHYVRFNSTKELLKTEYETVSDFCRKNDITIGYGEVIAISKHCQKMSEKDGKLVKTKINKNKKEVKMYSILILKKAFKIS